MFGRKKPMGLGLGLPRAAGRSSRRRPPFAGFDMLNQRWSSPQTGALSVALHLLVIGLLAYLSRANRSPQSHASQPRAVPVAVSMMYLPPRAKPARAKPLPPQSTAAPSPVLKTTESPLPAPLTLAKVPDHDDPAAMSPQAKPASLANTPRRRAPVNDDQVFHKTEDLMVSEARRIFGPKSSGAPLSGPLEAGRPVAMTAGGTRCAWEETDAGPDAEGPANGVVEGIVRTERGGEPLPGAFLQLLGTGSATFSDDAGHYRLTFDPRLVDRCHSQIVRVTAPGYRARTMVLAFGTWSDNVVDMRGR